MKITPRTFSVALAGVAALAMSASVTTAGSLDDFQSYSVAADSEAYLTDVNGGLSDTGSPDFTPILLPETWMRFGNDVADGVFVTSNAAKTTSASSQSGLIFASFDGVMDDGSAQTGFLQNQVNALYLPGGMNVSTYTGFQFEIKSFDIQTGAHVTGDLAQGAKVLPIIQGTNGQTWLGNGSGMDVATMANTFMFDLLESNFTEQDSVPVDDRDFDGTLASVSGIGFRLLRGTSNGVEGFSFDNVALTPEPASAVLLGVGMLLIGTRRSRREA